jgi:GTPase SAR1 family protein
LKTPQKSRTKKILKRIMETTGPGTNVFVTCFSFVWPSSLEGLQEPWLPEIKKHCPNIPYILVGLVSDVRDSFEECAEEY